MLRSDLCDYSDVYFVIKRRRTVEEYNDGKTWNIFLLFDHAYQKLIAHL